MRKFAGLTSVVPLPLLAVVVACGSGSDDGSSTDGDGGGTGTGSGNAESALLATFGSVQAHVFDPYSTSCRIGATTPARTSRNVIESLEFSPFQLFQARVGFTSCNGIPRIPTSNRSEFFVQTHVFF